MVFDSLLEMKKCYLLLLIFVMALLVSCKDSGQESKVQTVKINASVRSTGQYPEKFEIMLSEPYSGKLPDAGRFHMKGKAGAWGSNATHDFECDFESITASGETITLIPKTFPEKFFYVTAYEVTCSEDKSLSFSDEDVSEIKTEVADNFSTFSTDIGFDYHLFTPGNNENMPIVIVFHGFGDTNNLLTYRTAVEWAEPENQAVRPCYVLAPSIPDNLYYDPESRKKVLDKVMDIVHGMVEAGNVDSGRIYAMGNSFGGVASIEIAEGYTDDIAGVLALCPALNYAEGAKQDLNKIADIPIWFLHALNDGTISSAESRDAFKILQDAGAKDVRIKEFSDEEMNAAGAEPSNESTYSYHHVELAVMEDDTYMEWLYEQ